MKNARGRFRLIDAMALVAATASAFGVIRYYFGSPMTSKMMSIDKTETMQSSTSYPELDLKSGAASLAILLVAWGPVLLWAGWRRARWGRRVLRRPGLAACATSTVVSLGYLGVHLGSALIWGWPIGGVSFSSAALYLSEYDHFAVHVLGARLVPFVAPAALGALVVSTALARRRRPMGWSEWAGMAVALGWLLAWAILAR
jgi:hypothetical protein